MKKKITFIFLIVCFPYYLTAQTHSHQKDSLNNIPDSTSVRMPVRPVPFYSENKDYREIPLFTGKEHEEEYYRKYEPLLIPEYFLLGTMNGFS
ncbi:MAG: hypothetical protein LIO93_09155, partial [Bacteroidales bacterium]|nr:hypothetical protein [Bacteroidales bacterium]